MMAAHSGNPREIGQRNREKESKHFKQCMFEFRQLTYAFNGDGDSCDGGDLFPKSITILSGLGLIQLAWVWFTQKDTVLYSRSCCLFLNVFSCLGSLYLGSFLASNRPIISGSVLDDTTFDFGKTSYRLRSDGGGFFERSGVRVISAASFATISLSNCLKVNSS